MKKPNKPKSKSKKNHIFSNPQPKVRTIKELLDVSDLNDMTWREKQKFARYVNREAKKLAATNERLEGWTDFMTSESHPDPVDAFAKLNAQKEFINWDKVKKEVADNRQEYPELSQVLEDKDKWTILRRLAAIDPRLNIDRAYASETLREIEDMIEQEYPDGSRVYRDIDQITNDMMITYMETQRFNKEWDEKLEGFSSFNTSSESNKLYANQGFHGVKKAEARYNRERKRDLSGYEPMWQSPFYFED